MIFNNSEEAIIISEGQRKEMNISTSEEVQAHIIRVLTDHSYQRKIESIIREAVANSVDSNIEAGRKDDPVIVRLKRGPQYNSWYFETQDQGLGLDQEGFDRYIMGIGESTKRNNPDTFGYYGGGAKAPLCKVNSFDWICRKDGIERKFTIFKTDTKPNREIIYERPTTQPNGCIVHIDIPSSEDISQWKRAMREQLAYLPHIVYDVDGENWNQYKIYQAPDFEWRELTCDQALHISLGGIYYPIDWTAMGQPGTRITLPIALKFRLDEGLTPTFSREALQYNEATKQLILDKIQKVTEWMVDRYNQANKCFDTFWEAYCFIDNPNKVLPLGPCNLDITSLLAFTGLSVKEVDVKGVENSMLPFYKKHLKEFFREYLPTAQTKSWGIDFVNEKKLSQIHHAYTSNMPIVLTPDTPIGNFKNFLRQRFGQHHLFVKPSGLGISLFEPEEQYNAGNYFSILHLGEHPKKDWRKRIQEWQLIRDQLTSRFLNGDLKNTPEFQKYLEDKKEEERQRRAAMGYSSITLDKNKGDVTIGRIRKAMYQDAATYDRKAVSVQSLEKVHSLHVYFTWDEGKEKWNILEFMVALFGNVAFIGINPTEIKSIQHIQHFKTLQEFMKTRPFARAVTSIAIQRYLKKIPSSESLLYEAFPKYEELKEKLQGYVRKNAQSVTEDFAAELFEMASQNDSWDYNIYTEFLEFKKMMDECRFLNYFKDVDHCWPNSDKKMIKTLVYVFLKDRRLHNNLLESYELRNKDKEVPFDYYRPKTDSMGFILDCQDELGNDIWIGDTEAWKSREVLLEQYPGCTPVGFKKGDREQLSFQDELQKECAA